MRRLLVLAALLVPLPTGAVTMDWVAVGDPNNPADSAIMNDGTTGYGSVPYSYEIASFEVTNAQYAEFLNAVAASDPNDLYDAQMGSDEAFGGITRSGSPGHRSYAAKAGFENKPVVYVTFYDALRFANWLNNEQPVGAQGPATTEDGAYTLSLDGVDSDLDRCDEDFVVRNAGARVFLTSEDEWYKAAYYDGGVGGYYDYPTPLGFQAPECRVPGSVYETFGAANCRMDTTTPELTDVGEYALSPSPYGTFDQGGNVDEWNESFDQPHYVDFFLRGVRGGTYYDAAQELAASIRPQGKPCLARADRGFRVARLVPEPGQVVLVLTGGLVLAAAQRKRRA